MEEKKGNLGRGLVLHSMVLSLFAVKCGVPWCDTERGSSCLSQYVFCPLLSLFVTVRVLSSVIIVCHSTCSVLCYHCLSQYMFCPLLSLFVTVHVLSSVIIVTECVLLSGGRQVRCYPCFSTGLFPDATQNATVSLLQYVLFPVATQ